MITNRRNNKILCRRHMIYSSIPDLAKGLMFTRRKDDFGLVLDFGRMRKASLHMMFVFYPIDVVFLDEKSRAVEIKKDFRPFTFYNAKEKARMAVEVLAGTVVKAGIRIGDALALK